MKPIWRKIIREELNRIFQENETTDVQTDAILNNIYVKNAIHDAGLSYAMDENPENLKFDVAEAVYIFTHDYNDNNEMINSLRSMLHDGDFRPSPMLNSKEDLQEEGKMIYDALEQFQKEFMKEDLDFPAWERDYHDAQHYYGTEPGVTDTDRVSLRFRIRDSKQYANLLINDFVKKNATKYYEPFIEFKDMPKNSLEDVRKVFLALAPNSDVERF